MSLWHEYYEEALHELGMLPEDAGDYATARCSVSSKGGQNTVEKPAVAYSCFVERKRVFPEKNSDK